MRILVVEDEARLARHVTSALTEAGHDPVVIPDGETALGEAEQTSFDLIVLDVGLPGIDGFEVLRRLRANGVSSRVLMLTARGELNDRITGLQLGADDYLPKPFAMQELLARVRALGRRYPEKPALNLRVADLTLDLANNEAHRGGSPDRTFSTRTDVAKSADARTGAGLYSHRVMRAGLGAPARV